MRKKGVAPDGLARLQVHHPGLRREDLPAILEHKDAGARIAAAGHQAVDIGAEAPEIRG